MINQVYEILQQRKFDESVTPTQEQILLTIKGKVCAVEESFCLYTGLPKNGKSTFIQATIASAFVGKLDDIFGIKLHIKDTEKIVLFDTESSQYDLYRNIERIKLFSNKKTLPLNFDCFGLRGDKSTDIIKFISSYLENNSNCKCLIIDGLLDCIIDYNDIHQSKDLIDFIKLITKQYKILVIAVLHLGKKEFHTLGTLGSMADRYANAVLKVEKNKELQTLQLSATYLRSSDDFEPIEIKFFENAGWQIMDKENQTKKHTYKDFTDLEHKRLAQTVIPAKGLKYQNLIDDIKEQMAIGTNAAKDIVKIWIAKSVIFKREQIYYYD
jgi:hypothetical protein